MGSLKWQWQCLNFRVMCLHLRKMSLLNESLRFKKKKRLWKTKWAASHFKDVSILDNCNWLLTLHDEEVSRVCFFFLDDSLSILFTRLFSYLVQVYNVWVLFYRLSFFSILLYSVVVIFFRWLFHFKGFSFPLVWCLVLLWNSYFSFWESWVLCCLISSC